MGGLLVFALLGLVAACSSDPGDRDLAQGNLLIITFDTTRADRIGCYGHGPARTPVTDDLAANGVRFTDAFAQSPITLPTHTSILTGVYPPFHGARGNGIYQVGDYNVTLAEILGENGYQTGAVIAAFVLDDRYGLNQGFDVYDCDFSKMKRLASFTDASRDAPDVTRAALEIADGLDPNKPYFLWVHYFDPHAPYAAPPEFQRNFANDLSGRYDAEIATADHYLGQLIDGLDERGLMDDTLVVMTADHGEGFPGPHEEMTHGTLIYPDTLHIPLVFWAPGSIAEGRTVDGLVRQIDIAPTALDLLEIEHDFEFDGRSIAHLLDPSVESPQPTEDDTAVTSYAETLLPWDVFGWAPMFSIRDANWKYIYAPERELYDLREDPLQTNNLFTENHPEVGRLHALTLEVRDRISPLAELGGRPISAAELKRIQDLGYGVSDAADLESIPDQLEGLRDAKEHLGVLPLLEAERNQREQGNVEGALETLQRVLEIDPKNLEGNQKLANHYKQSGDFELALAVTEKILEERPKWATVYGLRGEIYMQMAAKALGERNVTEIERLYRLAIEEFKRAGKLNALEPAHPGRIGTILFELASQQQMDQALRIRYVNEALGYLENAVALDPTGGDARTNVSYGRVLFAKGMVEGSPDLVEKAIRVLESACASDELQGQNLGQGLTALSGAYIQTQRNKEAIATLERMLDEFPDASPQLRQEWQNVKAGIEQRMRPGG